MDTSKDILVTVDHITETGQLGMAKICTQAWYVFQITLRKQFYVVFGDPYAHSFVSGRLRPMGENCLHT